MKAKLKNIRMSHKKMLPIADIIRNKPVEEALAILKLMNKKGARYMYKVLHSAVFNAVNNDGKEMKELIVDKVIINKWVVLKRVQYRAKWAMHRKIKGAAHVFVSLGVKS